MKGALALALTLAAVWGVLIAIMSLMESRFLYFPTKNLDAAPSDFGLHADELRLTASDGVVLRGWWIRAPGIRPGFLARRVVLLFHGNGGNVSHRLERAQLFAERLGTDLFLVDWRGYGLSEGKPSETGLYRDGLAIYDAARERGYSPEQIVLLGESLGCPVALEVSLKRPVSGVALETPFLSVPAMARKHYPFVPAFLVRSKFDSESRIRRVAVPKLLVAAERDEIAPPSHARRLFEVAAEPKELFVVPDAGHNDLYSTGGGAYLLVWRRFLAR